MDRIHDFLLLNGWEYSFNDKDENDKYEDCRHYDKQGHLSVKIKDFICNLNYEDILLLYNYGDLVNFYAEGYVEEKEDYEIHN